MAGKKQRSLPQPPAFMGEEALDRPRAVLSAPGSAALIGAICGAWSQTETLLALVFSKLVVGHRHFSDSTDITLVEVLDSIPNFVQKRRIILAASKRVLSGAQHSRLESLLKRIQHLQDARNNIVHGRWCVSEDYPGGLVHAKQLAYFGNAKVYSPGHFVEILEVIEEATGDLKLFLEEVLPELEAFAQAAVKLSASAKSEDGIQGDAGLVIRHGFGR